MIEWPRVVYEVIISIMSKLNKEDEGKWHHQKYQINN